MTEGQTVTFKRVGHPVRTGVLIEILPRSHYGAVRVRWDDTGATTVVCADSLNREPPGTRGTGNQHNLNRTAGSKVGL